MKKILWFQDGYYNQCTFGLKVWQWWVVSTITCADILTPRLRWWAGRRWWQSTHTSSPWSRLIPSHLIWAAINSNTDTITKRGNAAHVAGPPGWTDQSLPVRYCKTDLVNISSKSPCTNNWEKNWIKVVFLFFIVRGGRYIIIASNLFPLLCCPCSEHFYFFFEPYGLSKSLNIWQFPVASSSLRSSSSP